WLDALVQAADEHPEAGAVGSRVFHFDGRLQTAGMILWQDGATSPPWTGEPPAPSAFDSRRAVDYCGSSSLLVRAATWDAIGGLDERLYPAYFVDVDLAMAVRELGQTVLYEPASSVRHHRGASTDRRFQSFVGARNRVTFVAKWERQLAHHEPRTEPLAAAVARAIARAEADGARRQAAFVPRTAPPRLELDTEAQEARHRELDRALHLAYAAHQAAEEAAVSRP
ncbi:MAG TPA: hypothetical protein VGE98_03105, partial [Thermoanaerobaculia bacterium]